MESDVTGSEWFSMGTSLELGVLIRHFFEKVYSHDSVSVGLLIIHFSQLELFDSTEQNRQVTKYISE